MVRVFVLASLAALAPFAIDTYLPAFHVMTNDLETNPHAIQQSLTFYLFPYALMTLFHGAISDAIGRIDTIKIGLGIFIVGSLCAAFATSVEILWLGRILQGIGGEQVMWLHGLWCVIYLRVQKRNVSWRLYKCYLVLHLQ